MSDTTFVDGSTLTAADWFNDINDFFYTAAGGAAGAGTITKLQFPAAQVASGDVNALDDYEEGTWTPANADVTITVTSASYTKIGNRVFANFDVTWPATANGNNASITGLPFAAAARNQGCAIASTNRTTEISAIVATGTSRIDLYAAGGVLSNANVSTERFIGTAVYSV